MINTLKDIFVYMLLLMMFLSCKKDSYKDDELSLSRRDYHGDELRIDGCYYRLWGDSPKNFTYYVLYNNSVIIGGNSQELSKMD